MSPIRGIRAHGYAIGWLRMRVHLNNAHPTHCCGSTLSLLGHPSIPLKFSALCIFPRTARAIREKASRMILQVALRVSCHASPRRSFCPSVRRAEELPVGEFHGRKIYCVAGITLHDAHACSSVSPNAFLGYSPGSNALSASYVVGNVGVQRRHGKLAAGSALT